jgi:endo-1,4-beta-D-glucanase Y
VRVQDPQTSNRTVSEGIGYGMLITVYMADKTTFDQLWGYEQAHLDSHGLMNWEIDSSGGTQGGGSATDADEDMAWALLMAAKQWPSGSYASAASTQISNMAGVENGGNFPAVGSNGSAGRYYDYFSPAYYPGFGSSFSGDVSNGYSVFNSTKSSAGLLPDCAGGTNGCSTTSVFGFDACRIPWRIGVDYCMHNSSSASSFLGPMVSTFVGKGVANLKLPMNLDGSLASGASPGAAIDGPAGVAAMISSANQTFINTAFSSTYSNVGTLNGTSINYFQASLGLLAMLEMSGNFFDYSNPPQ